MPGMTQRSSRDVSLTPEIESVITDALVSGKYDNAGEVVRTALELLRHRDTPGAAPSWPIGGGETGALIRTCDWGRSALGPLADWSPQLRTTVANVVNSPVPKVLMWGDDNRMLYNDGYAEICGQRHPAAFGATAREMWPEVWDWNRDVVRACGGPEGVEGVWRMHTHGRDWERVDPG